MFLGWAAKEMDVFLLIFCSKDLLVTVEVEVVVPQKLLKRSCGGTLVNPSPCQPRDINGYSRGNNLDKLGYNTFDYG